MSVYCMLNLLITPYISRIEKCWTRDSYNRRVQINLNFSALPNKYNSVAYQYTPNYSKTYSESESIPLRKDETRKSINVVKWMESLQLQ